MKNTINYTIHFSVDLFARKYANGIFLTQHQVWGDESRLKIVPTAITNNALFNLLSGNVVIEDYVFFGFNVSVLTGSHDYTKFGLERQRAIPKSGRDIIIKKGVFVGSNVTILGPCVIGEDSVTQPSRAT